MVRCERNTVRLVHVLVRPEMVKQDDVRNLIVAVHHKRPAIVDPTRAEGDVKRQADGDARRASCHVEDSNDVVIAGFSKRRTNRTSVRTEYRQGKTPARNPLLP